jgi:hypothetical protein
VKSCRAKLPGGGQALVEDVSQIDGRFQEFFRTATHDDSSPEGHDPYPFQTRLATAKELPELIDIPTGLGKTDAVVLAVAQALRGRGDARSHAPPPGVLPAHANAGGADRGEGEDVAEELWHLCSEERSSCCLKLILAVALRH